ncbi:APC family permease [Nocardia terpenica]|uniref:APC family permease n=1 Tax=Nocardia terpenica TaxID=455432 RepID=UPI0018963401|nr:APC family permease [Nocardia terpenica]MBF6060436.1 APC family permease [Nocardia terpenica]MBF6103696.1 APC family permease [Nocardia terpenica]MBF6111930.1 APC family permease [Nocardia terpenica]MBF6117917.1 APC family permease [Nocardia terpenica]MBF6155357.1 APC family permease [Nocardia terpenica]
MAAAESTAAPGLARGAIGLREVLFQSVTSMAPAGAVALSIAVGAGYAGGALPLAVLLALVACLLAASSIGQLAKHLPSAGSIYTYPAEALHPSVGFLVGWGYALVEALMGPTTTILVGYLVGSVMHDEFGWPFTATWIAVMVAAAVSIALLNYRGVQVSAKVGTVLGLFEIVVFLALAIWLVVRAGGGNTGSVFTLHFATVPGYHGFTGVAAASIYTVLAFIGFEASAPLAEEARNPRRAIPIAVVVSCCAIGVFYVFTTYAGDVYFGPHRYASFGELGNGSPWIALGRDVWGVGWVLVLFAILNSTFANGNAATLATTRTWFAMSRIGLLPAALARTHPRWNSPHVGIVFQLLVTLAIGLPVGIHFGPNTAFVFLATIQSGVMIAAYMVFNLSCTMFYLRRQRSEFNWLLHLVIPILGIAAFVPAWFTAMGIGSSALKFVTPLTYPSSETGLIIGIWCLVGIVVLVYLYVRHPSRLPEMRRVFGDEPHLDHKESSSA